MVELIKLLSLFQAPVELNTDFNICLKLSCLFAALSKSHVQSTNEFCIKYSYALFFMVMLHIGSLLHVSVHLRHSVKAHHPPNISD